MESRYFLYLMLFSIVIYSCTPKKIDSTTIFTIDPTKIEFTDIALSDIAEEITYIQFDSTVLFPGFSTNVSLKDSAIFIGTTTGLIRYDQTGKFVRKIGAIGQGPGEYYQYYTFVDNAADDRLFIFTYGNDMLSYNQDGTFLGKVKIKELRGVISPSYIYYFNGNFYFFYRLFHMLEKPYLWAIADESGNVVSLKQDINFQTVEKESNEGHFFSPGTSSLVNESFLYWNEYSDTIFKIKGKEFQPFGLWAKGDYRMTTKKVHSKNWDFIVPKNILDLDKYVLFAMEDCRHRPNLYLFIFYDKESKTFTGTNKPLVDDINGGLPIKKIIKHFNWGGHDYLMTNAQPYDLVDALLETDTPKSRELAKTIDDEGNPVMILIRLKK